MFTLLPLLTGEGRAHHGEILREATRLVEAGKVVPRVDPRNFALSSVDDAYRAIEADDAAGKIVVDVGYAKLDSLPQSAQHQLIEPVGERGRILRQFAVENLRLLQQQQRQIARGILLVGNGGDEGMAHVDLEDRLGRRAAVLLRQQSLELRDPARRRPPPGMRRWW